MYNIFKEISTEYIFFWEEAVSTVTVESTSLRGFEVAKLIVLNERGQKSDGSNLCRGGVSNLESDLTSGSDKIMTEKRKLSKSGSKMIKIKKPKSELIS